MLSLRTFTSVQCPLCRQPHVHLPPYPYALCSHSYTELSIQTVISAQCSPVQTAICRGPPCSVISTPICRGAPCSAISTKCSLLRPLSVREPLLSHLYTVLPVQTATFQHPTVHRVYSTVPCPCSHLYKYCVPCSISPVQILCFLFREPPVRILCSLLSQPPGPL